MEHTPTPWRVTCAYPDETDNVKVKTNGCIAIKSGVRAIGLFGHESRDEANANAAFIVRACNCHDELVATLKLCQEMLEMHGETYLWRKVSDILAKAEGK